MHPLLMATFLLNLLLINYVFGLFGLFLTIGLSFAAYYFVNKRPGDRSTFYAQKAAIATGHLVGIFAVANALWGDPLLTTVAIIVEVVVVFVFGSFGKR